MTNHLFHSDVWLGALERYGSETHLSVKLFDDNERVIFGPIHSTPLFQLFEDKGYDPGIFAECARRCLAQTDSRPAVMVSEVYGLAAVGTSLLLEGKVVGAAVGGYAFVDFSQLSEVQRLAKDAGIKFDRLWDVARAQKPIPQQRLVLNGELLQVLGDALLRENHRTRQYEQAVLELKGVAAAKDQAHQELQQVASTLRANEEHYRVLFDLVPTAVYSCDASGVIREFNRRAAELWGRTPVPGDTDERFCGSFKLFRPDGSFMPHEQCPMAEVVSGKISEARDAEVLIERPDASRIVVIVNIRPLKNQGGEVVGAVNCFYDITERKQTEEALRSGVERLRFVMESMPQKIFTATPSGNIDYLNHQWREFTGLTFKQIKDEGWTQFTHPGDLDETLRIWEHSIRTGELFRYEHRFRHRDGDYRWHYSHAVAMRDPAGKILMWIGSSTDIEDQRRSAESLRKAEKLAAAGRMAATIAHEINNPLEAVTNLCYLLNQNTLPPTAREQLKMLGEELERIVHITKQTLKFYREGSKAVAVDLSETIDDAIKLLVRKAQSQGARIETDYKTTATVNAYPGELRQVFSNLIINALEADATVIKVRVSPTVDFRHAWRRGFRVLFVDNGAGIPPDAKSKVFEPFVTTKADKGTGLGLWVSKGIIQKHEGWIRMLSSTNSGRRGTSFCIFLPEATRSSTSIRDAGNAA